MKETRKFCNGTNDDGCSQWHTDKQLEKIFGKNFLKKPKNKTTFKILEKNLRKPDGDTITELQKEINSLKRRIEILEKRSKPINFGGH